MFNDYIIKTITSDAESREEQDGGKHSFVGQTMAKLQAILQVSVTTNGKEATTKDFNLTEEGRALLIRTIRTGISW